MSATDARSDTLTAFDGATRALVRASAALAGGSDDDVRVELQRSAVDSPHAWVEELLLQTYLFAGFPRALNGTRVWRRIVRAPVDAPDTRTPAQTREDGERTCAAVYGSMYDRLRLNVRELHPLLDDWMITEGYGKVLSRPHLDLPRRELCIVAACAATAQDRQLQSHLHGARNVGVRESVIGEALGALGGVIAVPLLERAARLWDRIRHDVH